MIPAKIPSMTSLELISRMYNIPKNPVTTMIVKGTIIFTCGRLSVKIGLRIDVIIYVEIHISIPNIIAFLSSIVKP